MDCLRQTFFKEYDAITRQGGIHFAGIDFHTPVMAYWNHLYFLDLWETALSTNATHAMSSLAQRTPPALLYEVFHMALMHHHARAIFVLLIAMKKQFPGACVLGNIACKPSCRKCKDIRHTVFPALNASHDPLTDVDMLAEDFALVRHQLRMNKVLNLSILRRPLMLTHATTDVVTAYIFAKSSRNWTRVMVAVYAKIMWSKWIKKRLHPNSSYIKSLATRFYGVAV